MPSASSLASTAGVAIPASPRRKIGVCGKRRRSGGSRWRRSSTTNAALGSRPGRKPRAQQQSGAAFEPDERVIHVLVVMAVKERQLLRPMGRIVRAVEIEHEIGGMLVGPVGVRTEPVDADAGQAMNRGPLDRILQPRERGLRPERRASIAAPRLGTSGSWRSRSASLTSSYPAAI